MLALLWVMGASAGSPQWVWGGEHAFLTEVQIVLPAPLVLPAAEDNSPRVSEVQLALGVACQPLAAQRKRGWDLECRVLDVRLAARPYAGDLGLLAILDDYEARLRAAKIHLRQSPYGAIRELDLAGLDDSNRRIREGNEVLRLLVLRGLAPLDFQLPPQDATNWTSNGGLGIGFVSQAGTLGRVEVQHTATPQDDGSWRFNEQGVGIAGPGEMRVVQGTERPRNTFEVRWEGEALWKDGALLSRSYQMYGVPTPSSELADGGAGLPYLQGARLRRLATFADLPDLGSNEVLGNAP